MSGWEVKKHDEIASMCAAFFSFLVRCFLAFFFFFKVKKLYAAGREWRRRPACSRPVPPERPLARCLAAAGPRGVLEQPRSRNGFEGGVLLPEERKIYVIYICLCMCFLLRPILRSSSSQKTQSCSL